MSSVLIMSYFSFVNVHIRIRIRMDLYVRIRIRQMRIFMNSVTSLAFRGVPNLQQVAKTTVRISAVE